VNGQEYVLQVSLPAGYDKSNKKYPVVYLMDSQWDFPLVTALYGEQYFDGFIPELIIAGITWGGTHPNPDSLRARDYTPKCELTIYLHHWFSAQRIKRVYIISTRCRK